MSSGLLRELILVLKFARVVSGRAYLRVFQFICLRLCCAGKEVDHKTAFGRIAFSVPEKELNDIDKKIKETDNTILTPLISLDTPGKATVTVIILADPVCLINSNWEF